MYSVRSVFGDYGVYRNDELIVICNSRHNANLIKAILEKDALCNKAPYVFDQDDFERFMHQTSTNTSCT